MYNSTNTSNTLGNSLKDYKNFHKSLFYHPNKLYNFFYYVIKKKYLFFFYFSFLIKIYHFLEKKERVIQFIAEKLRHENEILLLLI